MKMRHIHLDLLGLLIQLAQLFGDIAIKGVRMIQLGGWLAEQFRYNKVRNMLLHLSSKTRRHRG